ncbi:nitrate reductase molybdenum cofactor assembly chaperone [Solemya pervernicosa gill symbiont]|uniref:Nitrate reductase molybdenum cofactor assembly chaperone n=2 Tax=Gammaproteobacteria incertae sedis TaxID=118884 RepID=A0A1T2L6P1_9GAMM|nr:nitrate reductase molybdenum cofactor assembly chaperone [Candidatus Reidiella endopervernicosa]OOZ40767.1 nitrate reductase molybdenum cofactor assembly chaperone [Solemya pervernicosa gill symbiont]QKQ26399.1 nitrate reductase molybdenum cofactor assembly chaperone [Candidatus Reidiella endopervernicosa]
MRIYKIMARILDYPTEELIEHLPEMATLVADDPMLSEQERTELGSVIAWLQLHDLIGLQQLYVNTFDMVPEHDLHLTHHLFGDDRGRGPALVDLSEHYKAAGLDFDGKEIPDFLPLILEYVSTLDEMQATIFLGDAAKVITVLAENLEKAGSNYASLMRIIENRGRLAQAA